MTKTDAAARLSRCASSSGTRMERPGKIDLINLLGLLRRAVLPCMQNPLADSHVLEPDERGHLAPWVRPDEQPPHFLEAYVLTNWKMVVLSKETAWLISMAYLFRSRPPALSLRWK